MSQLHKINVNLSDRQKKKLFRAYKNSEEISLRIKNKDLTGNDILLVGGHTARKVEKSRRNGSGVLVKIPKSNIRKQMGTGIFSSILPILRNYGPTLAKTAGLASLAGLASEGARQVVKKISGGQIFRVPNSELYRLAEMSDLLNKTHIRDLANAYNNGSDIQFKITQKQVENGIGNILASIGIPMLLNMFKGKGVGRGGPRIGMPRAPPPFIGTWGEGGPRMGIPKSRGGGKKKGPKI